MPSSLSADAKDALARTPVEAPHCRGALRDGLARFGADPSSGVFRTQRAAVARLAWSLLADRKSHAVRKVNETRLRRAPAYEVDGLVQPASVSAAARTAGAGPAAMGQAAMGQAATGQAATGPAAAGRRGGARCDRRMELRGAFLACGSLAAPARGYHLEFVPPPGEATARLIALLRAEGVRPKVAPRKGRRIVYFKDVDAITSVLAAIGASQAVFALEDLRALKETKNRIHRLVNTEAANVDRAMSAAAAQREAIALLADAYGLRHLKAALREVAELRLAHPTETLAELGRRCEPPVKKSTVNNRVATLVRMARALPAAPPADAPPAGALPPGELAAGPLATGKPPTGKPPTGKPPTGKPPTGTLPTGTLPTRTLPTGTRPTGTRPTGSLPAGSLPAGSRRQAKGDRS